MTSKDIYIDQFIRKIKANFPSIVLDDEELYQSYIITKSYKANPFNQVSNIITILSIYNGLDRLSKLNNILNEKLIRLEQMRKIGKNTGVSDLKLFQIYFGDDNRAKENYKEYCRRKTRRMSGDTKSLSFFIAKYGEEIGAVKYEKACNENRERNIKYSTRTLSGWLHKGFSLEDAVDKLRKQQTTFSLQICIEKYGDIDGVKRWRTRQDIWQNSLNSKSLEEIAEINDKKRLTLENFVRKYGEELGKERFDSFISKRDIIRKGTYSKESILFFETHLSQIFNDSNDIRWKENEYWLRTSAGIRFYDLTILNKKIIIEYHGEAWHPNVNTLSESELPNWKSPFNIEAKEAIIIDNIKKEAALAAGFRFFCIYSNDTDTTKHKIIREILDIL